MPRQKPQSRNKKSGQHTLKQRMPRRFKDHRASEARRYRKIYNAISERFPPRDAWGRKLTATLSDLMFDYEQMRLAGKVSRARRQSAARKTAGLILGMSRVLERSAGPQEPGDDLQRLLTSLSQEREDADE